MAAELWLKARNARSTAFIEDSQTASHIISECMPRLDYKILHQARRTSPLLARLLPVCRDIESASNELRWLREHVFAAEGSRPRTADINGRLRALVEERASGKPLQYVLGNQPFGDLEILCQKGVLIPRPETESIVTHLAGLIRPSPTKPLRILDLCTGTGCISLLLHSLLSPQHTSLQIRGVDISPNAIALSRRNLSHNIIHKHLSVQANSQVQFARDDIFKPDFGKDVAGKTETWDILISNPPYISQRGFRSTTARSVRNWEPKLALVPSPSAFAGPIPPTHTPLTVSPLPSNSDSDSDGDIFYPRLLTIAGQIKAKILLVEVGDMEQAKRVVGIIQWQTNTVWAGYQIWRDWPGQSRSQSIQQDYVYVGGKRVHVLGEGNGRAVLAWRDNDDGCKLLGMDG